MPCRDGGPDDFVQVSVAEQWSLHERLDLATRLLCRLLSKLEAEGLTDKFMDQEMASWWRRHQELDRARIAAEEAEKKRVKEIRSKAQREARLRREALKKLSPAERAALGFPDNKK